MKTAHHLLIKHALPAACLFVFIFSCARLPTEPPTLPANTPTPTLVPTSAPTPIVVSFALNIQPIFDANCLGGACHDAAGIGDLRPGASHAAIVDVLAVFSCTLQPRVDGAGADPDNSVLVIKIEGTTCGTQMPSGAPALGPADIALIRQWISDGAPNN